MFFRKCSTHLQSQLLFGFVGNYLKYVTQVGIWPHTQRVSTGMQPLAASLSLSLSCRGKSGFLPMWNFTTALCCSASCAAGEQTTTMAVDGQSFLCRGPSTIWPLAGISPADCPLIWRTAVMKERQGASHLAWPIMNRGQMNGFRGQSGKHLAMVIAVRTVYASQPEEWFPCVCGFRSLKPLCNCKKSCINHPPVTWIFHDTPLIIFTCPPARGVRAHGNNPADGTDSVPR